MFFEFFLEMLELAELEINSTRGADVSFVIARREDVKDDEREVMGLRKGGSVRKSGVVLDAKILVSVYDIIHEFQYQEDIGKGSEAHLIQ